MRIFHYVYIYSVIFYFWGIPVQGIESIFAKTDVTSFYVFVTDVLYALIDKGLHQCSKCGKCYKNQSSLIRHVRYACGKFICRHCGKLYARPDTLTDHVIRMHRMLCQWLRLSMSFMIELLIFIAQDEVREIFTFYTTILLYYAKV